VPEDDRTIIVPPNSGSAGRKPPADPVPADPVPAAADPASDPPPDPGPPDPPALRDNVLAGRFFTTAHRDAAEALAGFLAGAPAPLAAWFGRGRAAALAADPDALRGALDRDIAALDALLSAQVDAILHAPRLRRLEGSWRGLAWLVEPIDPGNRIKVKVLNLGWAEIARDLERAAEFDQSQLFRKIYEDEFGSPGGEPFGLLVIDHEVRHRPAAAAPTDDVAVLKLLAAVAAAAFAPTILSAAPELLELDSFADLTGIQDPVAAMRSVEYQSWRGLFTQDDIRFIAVALPRMLARAPWNEDNQALRGRRFSVPLAAVQRDRTGPFVLAADEDGQPVPRRVRLGPQLGATWVVEGGLSAGDRVLAEGTVSATRPQTLVRVVPADTAWRYAEHAPDAASRVWSTAGFAFAATVVRAFAAFTWPADVRGVELDRRGGGLVDGLVLEPFATDRTGAWVRPSLEVVLTDRQERLLVDAGLMPLSSIAFSQEAVFGAVRSLQMPQHYSGPNAQAAGANARLSSQINTLLCVSRFAHYLKMLGRDMVGAFRTAAEIEDQLQRWLLRYVNSNINVGSESRARFPLVTGQVTVTERPGRPGVFGCVIQMQPHFQLDDVAAQFRLVTDIAAPGTAG
jgi:predicted component of type VI protein secretion system